MAISTASGQLEELPPYLPQAVLATEDRRFYSHFGLDLLGLAARRSTSICAGWRLVQGGSTITQQLAKNVFLTPDRTLRRKGQEMLLALWLEQQLQQGPDPDALSQPGLFRRRHLWRRRGGAQVFRQAGRAGDALSRRRCWRAC